MARAALCFALLFALAGAEKPLHAQAVEEAAPQAIFHSYTNLIQIPVLVVSRSHRPFPPVAPDKFRVSLDNGPLFRPSHVRLEGEDAISLTVLVDSSENARERLGSEEALTTELPRLLHASDRVSVYALGCTLMRFADRAAATEPLGKHLQESFRVWEERLLAEKGSKPKMHLWDAVNYLVNHTEQEPGRRVLLLVSSGHDRGSKTTWNKARLSAVGMGVAVFAVTPHRGDPDSPWTRSAYGKIPENALDSPRLSERAGQEDIYQLLCELTGGLLLGEKPGKAADVLRRLVSLIRGRYVVEFPRNDAATAGPHSFNVTVQNLEPLVLSSGKGVPLPDAEERANPGDGAQDPARVPQLGNRHMLAPPK